MSLCGGLLGHALITVLCCHIDEWRAVAERVLLKQTSLSLLLGQKVRQFCVEMRFLGIIAFLWQFQALYKSSHLHLNSVSFLLFSGFLIVEVLNLTLRHLSSSLFCNQLLGRIA